MFSFIFNFHRIGYMLFFGLNHTQNYGWPGLHFIVTVIARESMYHIEPIAIDHQFQVGRSCPQNCSYPLLEITIFSTFSCFVIFLHHIAHCQEVAYN